MSMPFWSTACPDWEERILSGAPLIPFAPLFPQEAKEALAVMGSLRIVDAVGSPLIADACRPWILDFAGAIFGAYDCASGKRLIKDFFLLVSKKNSKSTIAAAIMLTALIRNWRLSAEFVIIAPTIEIADNSFRPAADMIAADPDLQEILHVSEHQRIITHKTTRAFLKVVAADNETVTGKKATGVLVDELWLFGKKATADSMLKEVTGGLTSRPEGFVIYLSTQSDEPPAGVFKSKLNYFRDVRDGIIDDRKSLGVLYEFPKDMVENEQCFNPEHFHVTNPNIDVSVSREFLVDEFIKAERDGGDAFRVHCSKHLNIEIGLKLRNDSWAGGEFWQKAVDESLTLDTLIARCDVAVAGIDGGGLDDLLGFCVIGREKDTRRWLVWCRAWAHPIVLERRKDIASVLEDLSGSGDLVICETPTQDVEEVAEICRKLRDAGLLPERDAIGVDKLGQPALIDALVAADFETDGEKGQIVGIPQGGYLNAAIIGTERKLNDGTLVHADQELMVWCVGNAKIEMKGSSRAVTKQASGTAKIDPLIAMFNAAMLMAKNPDAAKKKEKSFWETMGQRESAIEKAV